MYLFVGNMARKVSDYVDVLIIITNELNIFGPQTFTKMAPPRNLSCPWFSRSFFILGGSIGQCVTDAFSVTSPGNIGSPEICGVNTGQHSTIYFLHTSLKYYYEH